MVSLIARSTESIIGCCRCDVAGTTNGATTLRSKRSTALSTVLAGTAAAAGAAAGAAPSSRSKVAAVVFRIACEQAPARQPPLDAATDASLGTHFCCRLLERRRIGQTRGADREAAQTAAGGRYRESGSKSSRLLKPIWTEACVAPASATSSDGEKCSNTAIKAIEVDYLGNEGRRGEVLPAT